MQFPPSPLRISNDALKTIYFNLIGKIPFAAIFVYFPNREFSYGF